MASPLKILFALRDAEPLHYVHLINAVASRGHIIRVLYDKKWTQPSELEKLRRETKHSTHHIEYRASFQRKGASRVILFYLREILSYRRYLLHPEQSVYYRDRWKGYLPSCVQRIFSHVFAERMLMSSVAGWIGRMIEHMISPVRLICDDIKAFAPDVVFASPLTLRFSSSEVEYLKAALRLNIPTIASVLTWDNLTTKGIMHIFPDRLLAWNEVQAKEAVDHQCLPAERVRITGAVMFDDWIMHLTPSMSREAFCCAHGLNPEYPIVVYLGSSANMAADETWILDKLRHAFNTSDDLRMRRMQIIVRPHPANYRIYETLKAEGVTVIPKQGSLRDTPEAVQLFYNTMHYSEAAVEGANTTAIIESVIAGKPAIAFVTEEYKKTQMDTKHFNQLVSEGALYLPHTAETVVQTVSEMMKGNDTLIEHRKAFVKKYIRPLGEKRMAAEVIADEIEEMAHGEK